MTNNLNSNRKRILRFVALTWLLLVPMIIQAQRGNVTLNLQNEEVRRFIRQVEKQTNYTFVYRNSVLNPMTKVTLVCKNWPLEKALSEVFSPFGIQYSFNNNTIVLHKKRDKNGSLKQKKAKLVDETEQTMPNMNKISGLVREADGTPIMGASIFVKGTKIGTVTNIRGEFSLEVPANSTV